MFEYKVNIVPGATFGRWTVLDEVITTPRKEKKWLCQCSCGTRRYVLERSLRNGGSLSCGCLQREQSRRGRDLTGETFGELTVTGKAAPRKHGGVWWQCVCSCGGTCDVPATLLTTGKRRHCGGATHGKRYAYVDIAGQRFGRLTVQEATKLRTKSGSVIWRCRCDCGNEIALSYNELAYTERQSCGCLRRELDLSLGSHLTRVAGTSMEHIQSSKVPSNSSTGVKGVYLIKGRYVAKLVFRKKAYYLGSYDTMEEAAAVRKAAEEAVYGKTLAYHAKWQQRAAEDPAWGEANPMEIFVEKHHDELEVRFLPELD